MFENDERSPSVFQSIARYGYCYYIYSLNSFDMIKFQNHF